MHAQCAAACEDKFMRLTPFLRLGLFDSGHWYGTAYCVSRLCFAVWCGACSALAWRSLLALGSWPGTWSSLACATAFTAVGSSALHACTSTGDVCCTLWQGWHFAGQATPCVRYVTASPAASSMLTEHTWELALSVGFHAAVVCVAYLHCDHPCEHLARVCSQMCRCCGRTGNSSSGCSDHHDACCWQRACRCTVACTPIDVMPAICDMQTHVGRACSFCAPQYK